MTGTVSSGTGIGTARCVEIKRGRKGEYNQPSKERGGRKSHNDWYNKDTLYMHKTAKYIAKYVGRGRYNEHTYEIVDPKNTGFTIGDRFTPHNPERWFVIMEVVE